MADYSGDKLVIEIKAETKTAIEDIDALKKSLSSLNNVSFSGLTTAVDKIKSIANLKFNNIKNLKDLQNVNWNKIKIDKNNFITDKELDKIFQHTTTIGQEFKKVNKNAKELGNSLGNDTNITNWSNSAKILNEQIEMSFEKATDLSMVIGKMTEFGGLDFFNMSAKESVYTLGDFKKQLDTIYSNHAIENLVDKTNELNYSFATLNSQTKGFTTNFSQGGYDVEYFSKLAQMFAIIKSQNPFLNIKEEIKQCGGFANVLADALKKSTVWGGNLSDKLGGMLKSLKRIAFYRIVRGVLQLIKKALSEGINNLYDFSNSFGGTFSQTLDGLKTSLTYFINSLAVVIQPLIEIFAPVIEFLLDAFAKLNNVISAFFQGLSGSKAITQATKELVKFKKATTSLSIDELNTVSGSSGGFSLFGDLTSEESTITKFITNVLELIEPVFKIIEKISPYIGMILSSVIQLIEPINTILTTIIELLDIAFEPLMEIVDVALQPIVDVINIIGDLLNTLLKPAIELIKSILEPFFTLIKDELGNIKVIVKGLCDFVVGIFQTAIGIIKAVFETFVAFLSGDFEKIGQIWSELGDNLKSIWETTWKGIANFFIGIINGIITGFEWVLNRLIDGLNYLATPLREVVNFFGGNWQKLGYVSFGRIPTFAQGGVVEDGLFMANHNELIGGFGSKTAVANNEQITQGIYEAVKEAIQESNFGNGNESEIKVYLDSKEIAKQVKKVQKENGVEIYGGSLSYAK